VLLEFGREGTGEGLFQDARGVGVDAAGNIYVSDYENGRVQKFDPSGAYLLGWKTEGNAPLLALAVDRPGNVYVVRDGTILKYNGADGALLATLSGEEGDSFGDVTVLPGGDLLASSQRGGDEHLVRLDAQGAVVSRISKPVSAQTASSELELLVAADGLGTVFALGFFNGAVFKYSPEGKFVDRFGSGETFAYGTIAVDGQSRVYLSTFDGILVFDADGSPLGGPIKVPGAVRDMAFDAAGELFVVTSQQKVLKIAVQVE
jgi:DNA-binding beta-propeller fold protein YncE